MKKLKIFLATLLLAGIFLPANVSAYEYQIANDTEVRLAFIGLEDFRNGLFNGITNLTMIIDSGEFTPSQDGILTILFPSGTPNQQHFTLLIPGFEPISSRFFITEVSGIVFAGTFAGIPVELIPASEPPTTAAPTDAPGTTAPPAQTDPPATPPVPTDPPGTTAPPGQTAPPAPAPTPPAPTDPPGTTAPPATTAPTAPPVTTVPEETQPPVGGNQLPQTGALSGVASNVAAIVPLAVGGLAAGAKVFMDKKNK